MSRLRPFALAASITLGCALVYAAVVGGPTWGGNDDLGMRFLARTEGAPIPFLHPLCGPLFDTLYGLAPAIPWYESVLFAVALGSVFALVLAVVRLQPSAAGVCAGACAAWATTVVAWSHFQFTLLAGLAACGAVALGVSAILRPGGPAVSWRLALASAGLVLVGALLRFSAVVFVLAVAAPALLLLGARRWRVKPWRGLVVPLVLALCWLSNVLWPRADDWQRWRVLTGAKSLFTDYLVDMDAAGLDAVLAEVGWHRADVRMVSTWQYVDPVVFAPQKVARVAALLREQKDPLQGWRVGASLQLWKATLFRDNGTRGARAGLVWLALAALLGVRKRRASSAVWAVLLGGAGGLALLYLYIQRAPLRVTIAVWILALWLLLVLAVHVPFLVPRSRSRKLLMAGAAVFLLGCCVSDLLAARRLQLSSNAVDPQLAAHLESWRALPADALIYAVGSSIPSTGQRPFAAPASLHDNLPLISTGWLNQSPLQRRRLAALGLADDFFGTLASRRVYVVRRDVLAPGALSKGELPALVDFYRERYGLTLRYVEVEEAPSLYRLDFRRAAAPPGRGAD